MTICTNIAVDPFIHIQEQNFVNFGEHLTLLQMLHEQTSAHIPALHAPASGG